MLQKFLILVTSLNVLHNYFDSPTKLFSDPSSSIFRYFSKITFPIFITVFEYSTVVDTFIKCTIEFESIALTESSDAKLLSIRS